MTSHSSIWASQSATAVRSTGSCLSAKRLTCMFASSALLIRVSHSYCAALNDSTFSSVLIVAHPPIRLAHGYRHDIIGIQHRAIAFHSMTLAVKHVGCICSRCDNRHLPTVFTSHVLPPSCIYRAVLAHLPVTVTICTHIGITSPQPYITRTSHTSGYSSKPRSAPCIYSRIFTALQNGHRYRCT